MKQGSTIFLRAVILIIGLIVLALCIFVLPAGVGHETVGSYRPVLLGLYVPAVPFFAALYQALKLLSCIDNAQAFSSLSVTALKHIKHCAVTICAMFTVIVLYVNFMADEDDAPGAMVFGLLIIFASAVFAVFAAVLQKLLRTGMDIKSENDLTV